MQCRIPPMRWYVLSQIEIYYRFYFISMFFTSIAFLLTFLSHSLHYHCFILGLLPFFSFKFLSHSLSHAIFIYNISSPCSSLSISLFFSVFKAHTIFCIMIPTSPHSHLSPVFLRFLPRLPQYHPLCVFLCFTELKCLSFL